MKELLFNKSEAVAALNQVEGFNPMELARIINEGQEEQLYLDVKYRKLWFRLLYPVGKIVSHIVSFNENMAVVEARIYLDKGENGDSCIANAFSQKFRNNDPQFGDKFLEMAETAAIGRALSDAGFGLQFADVGEENDPAQVDAGISVPNTAAIPEAGNIPGMISQQMPGSMMSQQAPMQGQTMMNQFYQEAQASGNMAGQPGGIAGMPAGNGAVTQMPVQNPQTSPAQAQLDPSQPVVELSKRMTYEQATQVVVTGTGKYGGKTMGQIAIESPSSLNWFANDFRGKNNLIPAAARVILEKAMPMAG